MGYFPRARLGAAFFFPRAFPAGFAALGGLAFGAGLGAFLAFLTTGPALGAFAAFFTGAFLESAFAAFLRPGPALALAGFLPTGLGGMYPAPTGAFAAFVLGAFFSTGRAFAAFFTAGLAGGVFAVFSAGGLLFEEVFFVQALFLPGALLFTLRSLFMASMGRPPFRLGG